MRVKYNLNTKITFQVTGPADRGAAPMLHNAMYEYAHLNAVDLHVCAEKGGASLPKQLKKASLPAEGSGQMSNAAVLPLTTTSALSTMAACSGT